MSAEFVSDLDLVTPENAGLSSLDPVHGLTVSKGALTRANHQAQNGFDPVLYLLDNEPVRERGTDNLFLPQAGAADTRTREEQLTDAQVLLTHLAQALTIRQKGGDGIQIIAEYHLDRVNEELESLSNPEETNDVAALNGPRNIKQRALQAAAGVAVALATTITPVAAESYNDISNSQPISQVDDQEDQNGQIKQPQIELASLEQIIQTAPRVCANGITNGTFESVPVGDGRVSTIFKDDEGRIAERCGGPVKAGGELGDRFEEYEIPGLVVGDSEFTQNGTAVVDASMQSESGSRRIDEILEQLKVDLLTGQETQPIYISRELGDTRIADLVGKLDLMPDGVPPQQVLEIVPDPDLIFGTRLVFVRTADGADKWVCFDATSDNPIYEDCGNIDHDFRELFFDRGVVITQPLRLRSAPYAGNDNYIATAQPGNVFLLLDDTWDHPLEDELGEEYGWMRLEGPNPKTGEVETFFAAKLPDYVEEGLVPGITPAPVAPEPTVLASPEPSTVDNAENRVVVTETAAAPEQISAIAEMLTPTPLEGDQMEEITSNWNMQFNEETGNYEIKDQRYSWLGNIAVGTLVEEENGQNTIEWVSNYEIQGNAVLEALSLAEDGELGYEPVSAYVRIDNVINIPELDISVKIGKVMSKDPNDPHFTSDKFILTPEAEETIREFMVNRFAHLPGSTFTFRFVDAQDSDIERFTRADIQVEGLDTFLQKPTIDGETRLPSVAYGAESPVGRNYEFNIYFNDLVGIHYGDTTKGITRTLSSVLMRMAAGAYNLEDRELSDEQVQQYRRELGIDQRGYAPWVTIESSQ